MKSHGKPRSKLEFGEQATRKKAFRMRRPMGGIVNNEAVEYARGRMEFLSRAAETKL
jgi:hypothetical protein